MPPSHKILFKNAASSFLVAPIGIDGAAYVSVSDDAAFEKLEERENWTNFGYCLQQDTTETSIFWLFCFSPLGLKKLERMSPTAN